MTMDGLDGSEVQLEKCTPKKLYGSLKKIFVGKDEYPKEWVGAYDCCISVGCLFQSHFPKEVFALMKDSIKINDLFIFSMRDFYWDDNNEMGYKVTMDKMVADK
jgi:hypothetical protein